MIHDALQVGMAVEDFKRRDLELLEVFGEQTPDRRARGGLIIIGDAFAHRRAVDGLDGKVVVFVGLLDLFEDLGPRGGCPKRSGIL